MKNIFYITLIAVLVGITKHGNAQQSTWSKVYYSPGYSLARRFIELPDSGFILVGNQQLSNPYLNNGIIIRTTKFGDTLWTRKYIWNFFMGCNLLNDSIFLVTGGWMNTQDSGTVQIFSLNLNGDSLFVNYFGLPAGFGSGRSSFIDKCPDGGFIFNGLESNFYGFTKVDSNLNMQWHISNLFGSYSNQIISDPYSNYIAVGKNGYNNNMYGVAKISHSGNVHWVTSFGNDPSGFGSDEYAATDAVMLPDSNYLISLYGPDITFAKLDKWTGDTIWTKKLGVYEYRCQSIADAGNGKYICIGVRKIYLIDEYANIVWERDLLPYNTIWGYHIAKTKDGGFAFCGNYSYPGTMDVVFYFEKTDSMGNTSYAGVIENETGGLLNIYPNPATDYLYFSFNANTGNQQFTLYNLQGTTKLQSEITASNFSSGINISQVPNGLYIAELRNAKGDKVVRQKVVVRH